MTKQSLLKELKSVGTAQNRKIYGRHGVCDEMYGVSYANLDKIARRVKKEGGADLAIPLWDTGNHDAKVLATKILLPDSLNRKTANSLASSVTHSLQASGLAAVLAQTEFAPPLADAWLELSVSRSHWKVYTGWVLIASIALAKKMHRDLPDGWFVPHLESIAEGIHESPNEIRDQMNSTLIAIGSRNEKLKDRAIAVAKTIGKVQVDHGETSCKTPDAASYIRKVWDRKK